MRAVNEPLGIFVTLSAFGNRLHGDERGTVDRHSNGYGEPLLAENSARRSFERSVMSSRPVLFDEALRGCIEGAVQEACAFRGWHLLARHCRTNHFHAVVATDVRREKVMQTLKDRSTRAARAARLVGATQPLWARGGSGRYLWTEDDVDAACLYTMEGQGGALPGTEFWRREHE